ncbi:MAG TPA: hypothetical protein VMZ26_15165 [Pyrinomonadaceae bacterium]|nr:hypothetical protein [Pyrinomonadaceae bacterium]
MREIRHGFFLVGSIVLSAILIAAGCQPPAGNTTTVANSGVANTNFNSNSVGNANTSGATTSSVITTNEPDQYQANIKLTLETMGESQKASLPPLGAVVARSGADRVMEFTLPNNEKVIYLDKGGMNYVILPNRKQYAELTKEAIGFEVRRLLMPEQIVNQVKAIPGVRLVGEESAGGRTVVKYAYSGAANTQTQAGTVATESYILVDKETGLPVRSETVSQSKNGGNVQGVNGLRMVTEMTDIKTTPDPNIFTLPTEFQKIDSEQVKAQANLVFQTIAALVGQAMNQTQQGTATSPTPVFSPAR